MSDGRGYAVMLRTLKRISYGLTLPEDDVQRTIRKVADEAIAAAEATTAHPDSSQEQDRTPRDPLRPPEVVCLCGSSRFVGEMAVIAWELEKEGVIVLRLNLLPSWYEWHEGVASDYQAEAEGVADQMDELHLRKIDLADRVLVVNIGGYIGDSTRAEIAYCEQTGRRVGYVEEAG